MTDMAASRSSPAYPKTVRPTAATKVPTQVAKKAAAKKPVARSISTTDSRRAAEMLREIQIDGELLSAQIERLRHRFL